MAIKQTVEEIRRDHLLLRKDPHRYIEVMDERIAQDPEDASAYFSRHRGWEELKRYDLALADLDRTIALETHPVNYISRAQIRHRIGEYAAALRDVARATALETSPDGSVAYWGPLLRADCHARLGHEKEALAACAQLSETFWSPGTYGTPAGTKAEIIAEVRRRLASRRGD